MDLLERCANELERWPGPGPANRSAELRDLLSVANVTSVECAITDKIEIRRELLQYALNSVEYLALRADDIGASNVPVAKELRALLAALVVERQELVARIQYDDESAQTAFEALNPVPKHITKFKGGYAATEFNAWGAHDFCKKWDGFKQCAKLYAEQPAPGEHE